MKTFRLLSFILSLTVLMLLFKCGPPEPPIEKAVIEGTITNAFSGNPVKGVEVSMTGTYETISTGSDGKFSFSVDASEKGYTVVASHPDFTLNKKENVVAIAGQSQKVDILLQPIIPLQVNLSLIDLGATNTEETITITNTSTSQVGYTIQNKADWISIVPQNGTIVSQNTVQVKVTVDRSKLVNGDHQAELTINVPERGNVPITVLASKLKATGRNQQVADFIEGKKIADDRIACNDLVYTSVMTLNARLDQHNYREKDGRYHVEHLFAHLDPSLEGHEVKFDPLTPAFTHRYELPGASFFWQDQLGSTPPKALET